MTLSYFLVGFGAVGLLAVRDGMRESSAIMSAMGAGIVFSVGTVLLFAKVFVASQGSSQPAASDLLGCKAEVTIRVVKDGIGAVSYVCRGSRFTAPAKSLCGEEIPVGTPVRIRSASGNTLGVERDGS